MADKYEINDEEMDQVVGGLLVSVGSQEIKKAAVFTGSASSINAGVKGSNRTDQ